MERMLSTADYRKLSFWLDTVPGTLAPGEPLAGDVEVDVAIAGAGYTGLWTAYYLARAEPGLRIAVCEREIAGFGASGATAAGARRCSPHRSASWTRMAGRDAAIAMQRAMQDTVDEVAAAVSAEGIDCHWAKGGTVQLARSAAQLDRATAEVAEAREFGFGSGDLKLLTAAEARDLVAATGVLGGTYTPHCAAIHPARLVRGLAEAVRRRGVTVYERTPVTRDRARPAGHAVRHGPGQVRHPRDGGLYAAAARPAARDRARVLADDRHGAAAGLVLGPGRPRRQAHVR